MSSALRIGVSVGVLLLLFSVVDLRQTWVTLRDVSALALSVATLLFLTQTPLLAWRWREIVVELGGEMSLRAAVGMTLVGRVYNQVLPASIGGDAMRVWYGTRHGLSARTAAHSVIIERASGLLALLLIALLALPIFGGVLLNSVSAGSMSIFLLCGVAALAAGLLVYYTPLRSWPGLRTIADLIDSGVGVIRNYRLLVGISSIAVVSNFLAIGASYVIGSSLGISVEFGVYAAVIPLSILATVVPVSIAGWGVREGAIVALLSGFAVPPEEALALSLLFGITLLCASLAGGVLGMLLYPASADRPSP
jgi:uncharacterized membrane protein YbhN (UPF0104 family)